jgi:hypothetical protein
MFARNRLRIKFSTNANQRRSPVCGLAGPRRRVSLEIVMTFDMEVKFENERWRLLALVDLRKNLGDTSERAIMTDLEIAATRDLLWTYETLKGFWSQKDRRKGYQDARWGPSLAGSQSSQSSSMPDTSVEQSSK